MMFYVFVVSKWLACLRGTSRSGFAVASVGIVWMREPLHLHAEGPIPPRPTSVAMEAPCEVASGGWVGGWGLLV